MTTQDWVIIAAGWGALAAVIAGLIWDRRCDSRRLDRHRADLNNHSRRLVLIEGRRQGATSIGEPMPTVTKVTATISGDGYLRRHKPYNGPEVRQGGWVNGPVWGREDGPELFVTQAGLRSLRATSDPDPTLRLGRPPALSDIEAVLHQAGRDLTATELATKLERKTWDLIAPIDELIKAGKIQTVPGHTAGRTAYRLAGDTLRMARMPVLPGLVP